MHGHTQSDYNGGSAFSAREAERLRKQLAFEVSQHRARLEEQRMQEQMESELHEIWAKARREQEPDALIDAFEHKWRIRGVGDFIRDVIAIFQSARKGGAR
jgi:hypothetical protein